MTQVKYVARWPRLIRSLPDTWLPVWYVASSAWPCLARLWEGALCPLCCITSPSEAAAIEEGAPEHRPPFPSLTPSAAPPSLSNSLTSSGSHWGQSAACGQKPVKMNQVHLEMVDMMLVPDSRPVDYPVPAPFPSPTLWFNGFSTPRGMNYLFLSLVFSLPLSSILLAWTLPWKRKWKGKSHLLNVTYIQCCHFLL